MSPRLCCFFCILSALASASLHGTIFPKSILLCWAFACWLACICYLCVAFVPWGSDQPEASVGFPGEQTVGISFGDRKIGSPDLGVHPNQNTGLRCRCVGVCACVCCVSWKRFLLYTQGVPAICWLFPAVTCFGLWRAGRFC